MPVFSVSSLQVVWNDVLHAYYARNVVTGLDITHVLVIQCAVTNSSVEAFYFILFYFILFLAKIFSESPSRWKHTLLVEITVLRANSNTAPFPGLSLSMTSSGFFFSLFP